MKDVRVTNELKRIAAQNGGTLKADAVVDVARDPRSVLHKYFEWNNSKAAEAHRIWQARQLISVSVEYIGDSKVATPLFVSLSIDRHEGNGYRSLVNVLSDEDQRAQLLRDALHDLQRLKSKYSTLQELAQVFAAISKTQKTVRKKSA